MWTCDRYSWQGMWMTAGREGRDRWQWKGAHTGMGWDGMGWDVDDVIPCHDDVMSRGWCGVPPQISRCAAVSPPVHPLLVWREGLLQQGSRRGKACLPAGRGVLEGGRGVGMGMGMGGLGRERVRGGGRSLRVAITCVNGRLTSVSGPGASLEGMEAGS